MVILWILNSLTKEISTSLIYVESSHEMWTDLRDRFQQKNDPRIFQLKQDLINLAQELKGL